MLRHAATSRTSRGGPSVPVGLAGPLALDGESGRREVLVPLATTEGALVASVSRGMGLVARGGGVFRARVTRDELSQHPILVYPSMTEALAAAETARRSVERFQALVEGITKHGRLARVEPEVTGRRLLLRLVLGTGDAIGINMAAHAAELCSTDLAARTGAVERFVHGQDVEKRANARAMVEGGGRSVVCEAVVPRAVLAERARTTPEAMVRVLRTYAVGYAQLGTQNWTVQAANVLAALFLACGQDVAYVTECATGILDMDVDAEGDLVASVTLPSLLVGTVGWRDRPGHRRGVSRGPRLRRDGRARALAEVCGAAVLAGISPSWRPSRATNSWRRTRHSVATGPIRPDQEALAAARGPGEAPSGPLAAPSGEQPGPAESGSIRPARAASTARTRTPVNRGPADS